MVSVLRRCWRVVALATVRIPATPGDIEYTDRLTNTYQRIAESPDLRAEVERRAGGASSLTLSATPVPNTELRDLTARAQTLDVARRAADIWAAALVSRVGADARADQRATGAALTSELASTEQRLVRLRRELATTTDPVRRSDLAERIRIGELAQQALTAQAVAGPDGRDVRNVVSLSEPATPSDGGWHRAAAEMVLGLLFGLLAGAGVAFVLERREPQLDTLEEIERAAGASVLAAIPIFRARATRSPWPPRRVDSRHVLPEALRPALNGASVPHSAFGDLRARFLSDEILPAALRPEFDDGQFTAGRASRTLLVTSARHGDGKSTVAGHLAVALSRARHRVLLVDGDLRDPALHRYFGLVNDRGLSELLLAPREPDLARCQAQTRTTPLPKLSVLTGGPRAAEAAELLASTRMTDVIAKLKPDFEFVVIDSPDLATTSDAAAVVPTADAVIFVVGSIPVADDTIHGARRQLEGWGARTVGVVVNRCGVPAGANGGAR